MLICSIHQKLFYNDYIRYQREEHYLYEIANDIIDKCENTAKPIVYQYNLHDGRHQNRINEDNGWSLINWSKKAFDSSGDEVTKFINALGYNFTLATEVEKTKFQEDYKNNKINYLANEKIYEMDEYILVIIDYNI